MEATQSFSSQSKTLSPWDRCIPETHLWRVESLRGPWRVRSWEMFPRFFKGRRTPCQGFSLPIIVLLPFMKAILINNFILELFKVVLLSDCAVFSQSLPATRTVAAAVTSLLHPFRAYTSAECCGLHGKRLPCGRTR